MRSSAFFVLFLFVALYAKAEGIDNHRSVKREEYSASPESNSCEANGGTCRLFSCNCEERKLCYHCSGCYNGFASPRVCCGPRNGHNERKDESCSECNFNGKVLQVGESIVDPDLELIVNCTSIDGKPSLAVEEDPNFQVCPFNGYEMHIDETVEHPEWANVMACRSVHGLPKIVFEKMSDCPLGDNYFPEGRQFGGTNWPLIMNCRQGGFSSFKYNTGDMLICDVPTKGSLQKVIHTANNKQNIATLTSRAPSCTSLMQETNDALPLNGVFWAYDANGNYILTMMNGSKRLTLTKYRVEMIRAWSWQPENGVYYFTDTNNFPSFLLDCGIMVTIKGDRMYLRVSRTRFKSGGMTGLCGSLNAQKQLQFTNRKGDVVQPIKTKRNLPNSIVAPWEVDPTYCQP